MSPFFDAKFSTIDINDKDGRHDTLLKELVLLEPDIKFYVVKKNIENHSSYCYSLLFLVSFLLKSFGYLHKCLLIFILRYEIL